MSALTIGQVRDLHDKNPGAEFIIDGDRGEIAAAFPDCDGQPVVAGTFTGIIRGQA